MQSNFPFPFAQVFKGASMLFSPNNFSCFLHCLQISVDVVGLVDEWAARFFEELDYVNEGENGTFFAEVMRKDLPQVSIIFSNLIIIHTLIMFGKISLDFALSFWLQNFLFHLSSCTNEWKHRNNSLFST